MAIDILIPLGKMSSWENNELRYCLRGIEKHLQGHGEVFIVGERVKWLVNAKNVLIEENEGRYEKERNIKNKILAGIEAGISSDFLFMNDDHFLLADYEIENFPSYYSGHLNMKYKRRSDRNAYKLSVQNTVSELEKKGHPVKDFDVHSPVLYNGENFRKTMGLYNWDLKSGFVIKSLYCNSLRIEGEEMPDMKLNQETEFEEVLKDRKWFSIGDSAIKRRFKIYLESIYPNKSRYEI